MLPHIPTLQSGGRTAGKADGFKGVGVIVGGTGVYVKVGRGVDVLLGVGVRVDDEVGVNVAVEAIVGTEVAVAGALVAVEVADGATAIIGRGVTVAGLLDIMRMVLPLMIIKIASRNRLAMRLRVHLFRALVCASGRVRAAVGVAMSGCLAISVETSITLTVSPSEADDFICKAASISPVF